MPLPIRETSLSSGTTKSPAGLGDRHVYAGRSRFIPNRLLPRFEQLSWPEPPPELRGTPESRQAALDLAAKMRGMWD